MDSTPRRSRRQPACQNDVGTQEQPRDCGHPDAALKGAPCKFCLSPSAPAPPRARGGTVMPSVLSERGRRPLEKRCRKRAPTPDDDKLPSEILCALDAFGARRVRWRTQLPLSIPRRPLRPRLQVRFPVALEPGPARPAHPPAPPGFRRVSQPRRDETCARHGSACACGVSRTMRRRAVRAPIRACSSPSTRVSPALSCRSYCRPHSTQ